MRIFSFFLKLLLISGILGGIVYLFGGNVWLQMGTFGFIQDVNELAVYEKHLATYAPLCQRAPQAGIDSAPFLFQLRFTDNSHYVLELVCTLIEKNPIEIKSGSLPPLISKMPGSAGFVFPVGEQKEMDSAVRFTSLGKELGIELRGDTVRTGADIQPLVGLYPQAACASFGFSCCETGAQVGKGDLLSIGVTDCPTKCFPICQAVPFVELFNSDPMYDQDTREIMMTAQTMDVIFNYGMNPKTIKNVHIDFGDGTKQDSTFPDGIFTHTYTCTGACRYTVTLSAVDTNNIASVESTQSKIYIVKR